MFISILISSLAIFFAWLARLDKFKFGLESAFILLTIFLSIRYNFGNDYQGYFEIFNSINGYTNNDFGAFNIEIGWIYLNRIFKPFGFFSLVIFITIFEYYTIYRLIKRHVNKDWLWFSVFVFTFNPAFMLVCSSMMRQFLSICIFLWAIEFIIKKKWFVSILIVLFASLFHKSALILIPFCFLGYFNITLTNFKPFLLFAIYFLLSFIAIDLFEDFFNFFIELDQFRSYQIYLEHENEVLGTGLGVIFSMFMYLVLLLHQKYQSHDMKLIFILFFISVIFYLFSDITPLTSRLGYYFSILSIVCYPMLFKTIKNNLLKYTLLAGYFVITIKTYIDFFDPNGIWYKSFNTYQTIFSASSWY